MAGFGFLPDCCRWVQPHRLGSASALPSVLGCNPRPWPLPIRWALDLAGPTSSHVALRLSEQLFPAVFASDPHRSCLALAAQLRTNHQSSAVPVRPTGFYSPRTDRKTCGGREPSMRIPEWCPWHTTEHKTGVAISLQDPAEALEMSAGMLPFVIRRISAGDIRGVRGV